MKTFLFTDGICNEPVLARTARSAWTSLRKMFGNIDNWALAG